MTTAPPARRLRSTAIGLSLAVFGVVYLMPIIWMVLASFKQRVDIFSFTPKLFFTPTFDNYVEAFQNKGFTSNLTNSLIIAVSSTVLALVIGVPAAYSLSRHKLRFEGTFMLVLLAARLLPVMVLSVPLFVLANKLGLTGTYVSVIAAHLTFVLPFAVWMMRGFFMAVPVSLDEAARLDGCNEFTAFLRVALPLTKGGLAATAIFCLINSWNDFLFALILTSRDTATLPVAIPTLMVPTGTYWGQITAVATVTILPIMIFAFMVQRYIVSGMTGGALSSE